MKIWQKNYFLSVFGSMLALAPLTEAKDIPVQAERQILNRISAEKIILQPASSIPETTPNATPLEVVSPIINQPSTNTHSTNQTQTTKGAQSIRSKNSINKKRSPRLNNYLQSTTNTPGFQIQLPQIQLRRTQKRNAPKSIDNKTLLIIIIVLAVLLLVGSYGIWNSIWALLGTLLLVLIILLILKLLNVI